jgi:hypothetical protein
MESECVPLCSQTLAACHTTVGEWLSLVEHLVRDQRVGFKSSLPDQSFLAPTACGRSPDYLVFPPHLVSIVRMRIPHDPRFWQRSKIHTLQIPKAGKQPKLGRRNKADLRIARWSMHQGDGLFVPRGFTTASKGNNFIRTRKSVAKLAQSL